MIGSVSEVLTRQLTQANGEGRTDPQTLKMAASEFESLLVGEMLKAARGSGDAGWLGGGEDQAGSTMVEMAEQQLARSLASSGGLGLSKLIVQGLTPVAKPAGDAPGVADSADKK